MDGWTDWMIDWRPMLKEEIRPRKHIISTMQTTNLKFKKTK